MALSFEDVFRDLKKSGRIRDDDSSSDEETATILTTTEIGTIRSGNSYSEDNSNKTTFLPTKKILRPVKTAYDILDGLTFCGLRIPRSDTKNNGMQSEICISFFNLGSVLFSCPKCFKCFFFCVDMLIFNSNLNSVFFLYDVN
ncbi:uncharacterized protein [Antedon mediterranea]|uniref:uncharacterized protein isoform X1 n=1 Tax=Antedon mediterranea TaxID=105859 RepID=UPI003AF5DB4B